MRSLRVVVVGGGIGGLSAALALRSARAEVRVYEQAAELGEVGAGVGLCPNSMRILQRLGVADSVTRHAVPVNEWWMFAADGSVPSGLISEVPRQLPHAPGTAGLVRHDTHPRRFSRIALANAVGGKRPIVPSPPASATAPAIPTCATGTSIRWRQRKCNSSARGTKH
jgi:2-polyprenyl-6-methoxyphenol hydroxylase-like FAD-dependent oxidoreductase